MRSIAMTAVLSCLAGLAVTGEAAVSKSDLTVEQILQRHAAARGGLDAWHKVQTMAWAGHIESENAAAAGATFVMNLQATQHDSLRDQRAESKAVHIFDGTHGWKLRQTSSASP